MADTRIEFDWNSVTKSECSATVTLTRWEDLFTADESVNNNRFKITIATGMVQLFPVEGEEYIPKFSTKIRDVVFSMARTYFSAINEKKQIFEWVDDCCDNKRDIDFSNKNFG